MVGAALQRPAMTKRWLETAGMLVVFAGLSCGPSKGESTVTPEPTGPVAKAPTDSGAAAPSFRYPDAERVDVVDDYHGVSVADPYRWLEDLDSEQTGAWIAAQNEITFGHLSTLESRDPIRKRMTALWDYERWGTPSRQGKRYVVSRNDGLQNQSVIYTLEKLDGTPKVLLDPNGLSEDGTVALAGSGFSHDGELMAYGVSASGSDWQTWRIRNVATGKDLEDRLDWIKFSGVAWTKDNKGFYYARYDAPKSGDELEDLNRGQKLYYHVVGTAQADDVLVYSRPDHEEWGYGAQVTEDGRYLIIRVRIGTDPKVSVFYQRIPKGTAKKAKAKTVELLPDFKAGYAFLGNRGPEFFFRTDDGAPKGRIIAIDTRKPADKREREVVGESANTLRSASFVGDSLVLSYLENARARVERFDLSGKSMGQIELPGLGSVSGFGGKQDAKETFYAYSSFATPGSVYRLDLRSGKSQVFREPKVDFDPADFVTEQVFYESLDGTKIPMFISRHKDTKPSADTPTYLYGYGGFDIAG